MKYIALALLVVSSFSFARELDATAALKNTLALGVYTGVNASNGESCTLSLAQDRDGIYVTAISGETQVVRFVPNGSVYRWNPAQRMFLSSSGYDNGRYSESNVFRTIAITDSTQYTVVSQIRTDERRVIKNEVECEINL